MSGRSILLIVILVFGVLFSMISISDMSDSSVSIPTLPKLSEDDAIDIMNADLKPRLEPATINSMFIYGRYQPAEMKQLPLVYYHNNGTQFYINSTAAATTNTKDSSGNFYVIDASCTPSKDSPCFTGNKVLDAVRGHLVYVIDGGWSASDGKSSPMYYYIDAMSGRILWSYVGEDSYPELRTSDRQSVVPPEQATGEIIDRAR